MSDITMYILNLVQHTPAGGQARGYCPFCTATHENSFVARRDSNTPHLVWYQCYRAACGARGRYSDKSGLTLTAQTEPVSGFDPHVDAPPINEEHAEALAKYGVTHAALVRYGVRSLDGEVIVPLWNVQRDRSRHVGWQYRALERKSIRTTFFEEPHFQYSALNIRAEGRTVVVENPLSAIRVVEATSMPAIALLGHILTPHTALHLAQQGQNYRVLLDPDTWPGGVTRVLRTFESVGVVADARYIHQKPYAMTPGALREAVS